MRKILIIILTIFLSSFCLHGQLPEDLSELKNWHLKGMARSALRINDNYQARDLLEEWYKREPNNEKIGIQYGKILVKTRDYIKAEKILFDIYNQNPQSNPEALYLYAQIQKTFGNYEEAIEHFDLLRRRSRRIGSGFTTRAQLIRDIEGCQMGIAARDTLVTKEIIRLNETINSPYIEFGPVIINDTEIAYGSVANDAKPLVNLNNTYTSSRQFYKALYDGENWQGGLEPDAPFHNSENVDTGRGAFSVNRERFYSVGCATNHKGKVICHLFVSRLQDGEWSEPEKLDKSVNHPRFTSTQPAIGTCFDSNLEVLYFVSDRPGGAGGMDIWFSLYNKRTGKYQKAENAGVFINTSRDELTPWFDLTSHRLYFSSDGWPGYGGLDIFYSAGNMVTWEIPVNIGAPINSSWDDMDFVKNQSGKFGLFTSNRPGILSDDSFPCCDDLFAFIETKSPRVLVTGRLLRDNSLNEGTTPAFVDKTDIIRSDRKDSLQKTEDIIRNQIISISTIKDSTESVFLHEIRTGPEGEFELWVDPGQDYQLTLADTTLLDRSFTIPAKDALQNETIDMSTVALNVIPQRTFTIENIYYEFDRTELTPDAKSILDTTLLSFLKKYPHIIVEISSHTDNIGDKTYNQRLSENRAASVAKHLTSKGIPTHRMETRGFGQSRPVAPNQHDDGSDNPEGRSLNRRTEFRIIGHTEF